MTLTPADADDTDKLIQAYLQGSSRPSMPRPWWTPSASVPSTR
jgi:hypothetical protein